MSDRAAGGNDILNGGSSDDTLYGDAASYNPSSPGSISGGKDILNGGAGDDQLWGGPNNDTFVFGRGSGNDTINDFNQGNAAVGSPAQEHDVIDLRAYGFADWNALRGLISDNSSGNAVIQLSQMDSITLVGVHSASLKASDFIISGSAPKVI
jgi:Ca2+-binding RTX toxin-like protein